MLKHPDLTSNDVVQIIENYGKHWVESDATQWGDIFTETAEYRCHPVDQAKWYNGREAIMKYFNDFVVSASNEEIDFYHHADKLNWNPSKKQANVKFEAKIQKTYGNVIYLVCHAILEFKNEDDPFRISYFEELSLTRHKGVSEPFQEILKKKATSEKKPESTLKKSVGKQKMASSRGFKKKPGESSNPYLAKKTRGTGFSSPRTTFGGRGTGLGHRRRGFGTIHPGGFNTMKRGGFSSMNRGGFNSMKRGGFNSMKRGGFNSMNRGRGGFDSMSSGRGGFNSRNRGGFDSMNGGGSQSNPWGSQKSEWGNSSAWNAPGSKWNTGKSSWNTGSGPGPGAGRNYYNSKGSVWENKGPQTGYYDKY